MFLLWFNDSKIQQRSRLSARIMAQEDTSKERELKYLVTE
jgi:hypothetical protein